VLHFLTFIHHDGRIHCRRQPCPTTMEAPTRALGNNYGTVIDGARRDCSAILSASHRPRLSAYPRQPPEKARPHCTACTGPRHPRSAGDPRATGNSVPFREPLQNIPSSDSLPSKEFNSMAVLIKGSKPGPSRVRQAPQIAGVIDCMDVPYKLPSNTEFETSHTVFKAGRSCLAGGSHRGRASSPQTLSKGSEPRLANLYECFMRCVPGLQADPF
jgi:hypothetical protein